LTSKLIRGNVCIFVAEEDEEEHKAALELATEGGDIRRKQRT
jgi:hypothetical protein